MNKIFVLKFKSIIVKITECLIVVARSGRYPSTSWPSWLYAKTLCSPKIQKLLIGWRRFGTMHSKIIRLCTRSFWREDRVEPVRYTFLRRMEMLPCSNGTSISESGTGKRKSTMRTFGYQESTVLTRRATRLSSSRAGGARSWRPPTKKIEEE